MTDMQNEFFKRGQIHPDNVRVIINNHQRSVRKAVALAIKLQKKFLPRK